MTQTRKISVTTGVLFLVATITSVVGTALEPSFSGANYLAPISEDSMRIGLSALLHVISAAASVGIAISLFPLLKKINSGLAIAAVVFRTVEAVFQAAAVVLLLAFVPLARQLVSAPSERLAALHAIANTFISLRDTTYLVSVIAFGLGALCYYLLLYRSKLMPTWLSGWGIISVILLLGAAVLVLFTGKTLASYPALIVSIAIQEIVFALWLLFKGFRNTRPNATESIT